MWASIEERRLDRPKSSFAELSLMVHVSFGLSFEPSWNILRYEVRVLDSIKGDTFEWCFYRVLVRSLLIGFVCEPVTVGTVTVRAVVRVEF
ncbi:hypothetical protein U1Q18_017950 [Sarracenia purpurea var. burkii]